MVRERGNNYRASAVHARIIFGHVFDFSIFRGSPIDMCNGDAHQTHGFRAVLGVVVADSQTLRQTSGKSTGGLPLQFSVAAADATGSRRPLYITKNYFSINNLELENQ